LSQEPAVPRDLRCSWAEKLVERYERSPRLRALVSLVASFLPPANALETAVLTTTSKIRSERLRELFDELDRGGLDLSDELIQQEDFLHAFVATVRAADRTRQKEKIRLLGRLLKALAYTDSDLSIDEHEEFLRVLEDLSPRELMILICLKRYEESTARKEQENTPKWISRFWESFKADLKENLDIPLEEVEGYLARLSRTGFYHRETGFLDETEELGCTTPNFKRFLATLEIEGRINPPGLGSEDGLGAKFRGRIP